MAKRGQSGMTWFTYKRTPNAGGEEQKDWSSLGLLDGAIRQSAGERTQQTDSVDSQSNMQKKGKVREYTPEGKEKGKPKL